MVSKNYIISVIVVEVNNMATSESQKRASAKWNAKNQKTIACAVNLEEHAAFKAYAESKGKTISGMLLEYVRGCIAEDKERKKNPE